MVTDSTNIVDESNITPNTFPSPDKNTSVSSYFTFQFLRQRSEQIAKQLRQKAKALNDIHWIYGLYGLFDGVGTSFSMLKYTFDIIYTNSSLASADMLHDFLLTPEGILIVVAESILLAGLAINGNVFDENNAHSTPAQKYIASIWRYCRDALKALKNAYKGIRNGFFFLSLLAFFEQNLTYLILPLGLSLGVLSAFNRMFLRYMRDERKTMMKNNKALLKKIQALTFNSDSNLSEVHEHLKHLLQDGIAEDHILGVRSQSLRYRILSYMAAFYNGLMDAPYLFLGMLSLTALNPTFFIILAVFSAIYLTTCVIVRVFEEYNYQRLLFITQSRLELAACITELEFIYNKEGAKTGDQYLKKANEAVHLKETLDQQLNLSIITLIISGLRNGMDAYGVLSSVLFVVSTLCLIFGAPFPSILLIICGAMGLAFLSGFATFAVFNHYEDLKAQHALANTAAQPRTLLKNLHSTLDQKEQRPIEEFHRLFLDALSPKNTRIVFLQDWFEVLRLWCSGWGKGFRSVDETMVAWQDIGDDGHYHDTEQMAIIAWLCAAVFATTFALRGFARLGRDNADDETPSRPAQPTSIPTKIEAKPVSQTQTTPVSNKLRTKKPSLQMTLFAHPNQANQPASLTPRQHTQPAAQPVPLQSPNRDSPEHYTTVDLSSGHYTSCIDDTNEKFALVS